LKKGSEIVKLHRTSGITIFVTLLFITVFLNAGCGGQQTPNPATSQPAAAASAPSAPAEKKILLSEKPGEWKADGIITDNEYSKMQVFGEMEVYSRVDGDKVRIALKAKTEGYVAIGFDPTDRMKDAEIILGGIKDGKPVVFDMFSTGATGPHPPKEQLGGTNDVTVFSASKKDGVTIVEFERKLVTGDPKGKEIRIGDNKIIWAIGASPDLTDKHVKRGSGILKL